MHIGPPKRRSPLRPTFDETEPRSPPCGHAATSGFPAVAPPSNSPCASDCMPGLSPEIEDHLYTKHAIPSQRNQPKYSADWTSISITCNRSTLCSVNRDAPPLPSHHALRWPSSPFRHASQSSLPPSRPPTLPSAPRALVKARS